MDKISQRTLGDAGPRVTVIGLGLAALGRPGYINLGHGDDVAPGRDQEAMRRHCYQVLDLAWTRGIRYFDAARSYGLSEAFLAGWLQASGHRPTVGSKWGYRYTAEWRVDAGVHEVKDHGLGQLQRQWGETNALLGDHLHLYQIHSATLESGVLTDARVLNRLAALKAEHRIGIGLTLSGPHQADTLARALAVRIDGQRLFDTVQATWNLLEPSAGQILAAAAAEGLGIIVKEAVANGRLTGRNRDPGFAPRREVLEQEATRLGVGLDGLAIAAVLARPWVSVVLSGAATRVQLDQNLAALDLVWDEQAEMRLAEVAEPAEVYWTTRSALAWN